MAIHRLSATQIIPTDLPTAWEFFSDPRNLSIITPPSLGLRITQSARASNAVELMLIGPLAATGGLAVLAASRRRKNA